MWLEDGVGMELEGDWNGIGMELVWCQKIDPLPTKPEFGECTTDLHKILARAG
jgi:hypothetical protein